jgi:hypothetical protein
MSDIVGKLEMTSIQDGTIGKGNNSVWLSSVADVIEGNVSRVAQSQPNKGFTAPDSALKWGGCLNSFFNSSHPQGFSTLRVITCFPPVFQSY